jgi:hypothetical protein
LSPSVDPDTNVILDTQSASNVLWCAVLDNATTGIFFPNMTGSFLVTPLENIQAHVVAYTYDTTTIFAKSCPDFNDVMTITVFEDVFNKLKSKGYIPRVNVTDN